jgi:hypothetical protein
MNRSIVTVFCLLAAVAITTPVSASDREHDRDYAGHHGYRERPYDRARHYGHYNFRGHRYAYHGHWRSWDEWDRYARKHPYLYKRGRYYHDGAHLMFRFCEPDDNACVFFSIGR